MICGIVVAGVWMLVNAWLIAGLCHEALRARAQRRWWRIAGYLVLKAPLLYGAGYLAVVWLRPSAIGLAIGVTLGLAVLMVQYVRTVRAAHG